MSSKAQRELDELARRFGGELTQFAFRKTGRIEDAVDVVQRAFVKAWSAYKDGAIPDRPRAWLYAIVRNEAIDYVRQKDRRRGYESAAMPSPLLYRDPHRESELGETLDMVRSLPEPFLDAILVHYIEGFSIQETAQILGIPAGTAMSQIARGLNLLRRRLNVKTKERSAP